MKAHPKTSDRAEVDSGVLLAVWSLSFLFFGPVRVLRMSTVLLWAFVQLLVRGVDRLVL